MEQGPTWGFCCDWGHRVTLPIQGVPSRAVLVHTAPMGTTSLHPTSDAAAVGAGSRAANPGAQLCRGLCVCVQPVLLSGAGESPGNRRGKGKGFDFHSLGPFPLPLSHSPIPSSPPSAFCHIVLSLNQTFTKGIRGSVLINSKAGWKRGNQPWRSAEGHSCSGGPGRSKSPG